MASNPVRERSQPVSPRRRAARAVRIARALAPLALLGVAVHCGSSSGSTFGAGSGSPCETIYAGLCGRPCTSDDACAEGLYCGSGGACTADCSPEHACAGAFGCSARGRCSALVLAPPFVEDAGPIDATSQLPDSVCADVDVTLSKILPKVLFLLDQSSSMHIRRFPAGDSNDCNPDCRWTVLKDVLIGPASDPGGLIAQLEGEAELAVEMYSATDSDPNDGDNSYLTGPTDDVCPRFNGRAFDGLTFSTNAYAEVEALLRPATVDDDTPTGPAIRSVVGLTADGGVEDGGFAAVPGSAPKVLVLVTDGEPAICGQSSPSNAGREAVVSAVQETYTHGIKTFVIAIGDVAAEEHFNAVANAGQGLDPETGDAGAIRPNTKEALITALREIVLDARTCTFDLNGEVQPGMESLGVVTLNGAPVPLAGPSDPSGWRLVSPTRIELVGAACATLKATPDAQLSARFPCNAISRIPK